MEAWKWPVSWPVKKTGSKTDFHDLVDFHDFHAFQGFLIFF